MLKLNSYAMYPSMFSPGHRGRCPRRSVFGEGHNSNEGFADLTFLRLSTLAGGIISVASYLFFFNLPYEASMVCYASALVPLKFQMQSTFFALPADLLVRGLVLVPLDVVPNDLVFGADDLVRADAD